MRVCNWSHSNSLQISRTLLSILADLNIHSLDGYTHPLIFNSSCPCTNPLVTVSRAPITICITFTFMFHSFFSRYLYLFFLSFSFTVWSAGTSKSTIRQFLFVLLTITRSGRLAEIRWSVCISKSQGILWVSFSKTDSGLCIYHLFGWPTYYHYYYTPWEFFTLALAGGLALGAEWQQISLGLQNSSELSGRSQQCWVWKVSILLQISTPSSLFSKLLGPFHSHHLINHDIPSFEVNSDRSLVRLVLGCLPRQAIPPLPGWVHTLAPQYGKAEEIKHF